MKTFHVNSPQRKTEGEIIRECFTKETEITDTKDGLEFKINEGSIDFELIEELKQDHGFIQDYEDGFHDKKNKIFYVTLRRKNVR